MRAHFFIPIMAIAEIKEIVPPRMRHTTPRLALDGHGETPGSHEASEVH